MAGRDGRDLGPRVLELLLRRDARRGRAWAGRPGRAERALPADADGDGAVAFARRHHHEDAGLSDVYDTTGAVPDQDLRRAAPLELYWFCEIFWRSC